MSAGSSSTTRCWASTAIVLTPSSFSVRRIEPVSATPSGVLTTVTSTSAGAAQSGNWSGVMVPVTSGTAEQIRVASGNVAASHWRRPAAGGGMAWPSRWARAAVNRSARSPPSRWKSGTRGSSRGAGPRSRMAVRMSSRASIITVLPAVASVPLVEGLLRRFGHVAVAPPGVEPVIDGEVRQDPQRGAAGLGGRPEGAGVAEQSAGQLHGCLLGGGEPAGIVHDLAPGIDLLVDVDLHRADVGAAAVDRRGERELAVTAHVGRGHGDQADRAHVGRAVGQAAAAPVDRA